MHAPTCLRWDVSRTMCRQLWMCGQTMGMCHELEAEAEDAADACSDLSEMGFVTNFVSPTMDVRSNYGYVSRIGYRSQRCETECVTNYECVSPTMNMCYELCGQTMLWICVTNYKQKPTTRHMHAPTCLQYNVSRTMCHELWICVTNYACVTNCGYVTNYISWPLDMCYKQ